MLLGGRIADFFGRKRTFLIGLVGFAGASALGGAATNGATLFAARGLQGVFGALLAPAALSLITVTFTESKERARAFGVYGAVSGGGGAIGLIAGGLLTEYSTWRWCLYVNVPIALIAFIAAIPLVRESHAQGDRHYDVPGAVLATAGLAALVYGFTRAATDGWSAGATVAWLVGAVVVLVGFTAWEARTAHPLLPLRVVLDRNRGASFLISVLISAALLGMFLFMTFFLQQSLGYSALRSGVAYLPFSAGIVVAAAFAAQFVPRLGARAIMAAGGVLATASMAWLIRLDLDSAYATAVLPSFHRDGPRDRADLRPAQQHRTDRRRRSRRRRGQRDGELHPAGRWVARNRPAQHHLHHHRRELPDQPRHRPGAAGAGGHPRLQRGLHRQRRLGRSGDDPGPVRPRRHQHTVGRPGCGRQPKDWRRCRSPDVGPALPRPPMNILQS